jgi:ubiquitin C-terminal hydrolase
LQVVNETGLIHEIFYENLFYNPEKTRSMTENKCKTKESRHACFALLQKVLEVIEPKDLALFLQNNLWPLIKDVPAPKKWLHQATESSRSNSYVGIVNLGCICYMNAML